MVPAASLFNQLLQHFPRTEFAALVRKHQAERRAKAEAERKRKELAFDRRAYRLGMKLLQSESEGCVKRCVKKCIAKKA